MSVGPYLRELLKSQLALEYIVPGAKAIMAFHANPGTPVPSNFKDLIDKLAALRDNKQLNVVTVPSWAAKPPGVRFELSEPHSQGTSRAVQLANVEIRGRA